MLRDLDADVVALQEANERAAAERLAAALGMEIVYGEANSEFAVAWLSRLPIARAANHRLPVLDKTLLEIEVEGLRLATTHLSAGRLPEDEPHRVEETRAILAKVGATADLLAGDFNAVHPSDEIGVPPPEEQVPDGYVSRRPVELVLQGGFADCFRELHPDARGWTYATGHLWARFDFVFASPRVACERCAIVDDAAGASDHLPVVADVRGRE